MCFFVLLLCVLKTLLFKNLQSFDVLDHSFGALPENKRRNRFENILPCRDGDAITGILNIDCFVHC